MVRVVSLCQFYAVLFRRCVVVECNSCDSVYLLIYIALTALMLSMHVC